MSKSYGIKCVNFFDQSTSCVDLAKIQGSKDDDYISLGSNTTEFLDGISDDTVKDLKPKLVHSSSCSL